MATPPTITTSTALPCAELGDAYSETLASTGDTPITYALVGGSFPPGISLSSAGVISGTATPFRFDIQIADSSGAAARTQSFAMLICCEPPVPENSDPPVPIIPVNPVRSPLQTNFRFVRRDCFRFTSTVYLNGEIVDLTGAAARLTAKYSVEDDDADAVFCKYSPFNGISFTDPTNGELTVTLTSADTASLPDHVVNLVYDLQLYYPVLITYTVQAGIFEIVPDISETAP